jgi:hypothetical protein
MAIKKPDDHVQCVLRLRDICVVKESMKESFPNMEFGLNPQFD